VFQHCDKEFLLKFPDHSPTELKRYRQKYSLLGIKSLIDKALIKQGPQDPSSSQTGDLPTSSCHGLGLLARAASDAEKSLLAVKPVDQLLRAMDSRPEFDDPDSVNVGRGASEYLCCSDSAGPDADMNLAEMGAECEPSSAGDAGAGADVQMPAKPPPFDGADADASRRRNAQQSSVTASRRSAAAGADAGEVGVAQASGTRGEPTFTPTVPEPSDRGTRRLAAAANLSVSQHRLMSGLAADSTSSFSAAASSALHASRRRACAEAAQRGWKVLSSRLMKSHRAPATPDPPAVATGTLSSNNDSSRDRDEDQDGQGGKKQESEGGWNLEVKLR
jgi:hypothetical protein